MGVRALDYTSLHIPQEFRAVGPQTSSGLFLVCIPVASHNINIEFVHMGVIALSITLKPMASKQLLVGRL